ncbi:glycosyltransferase family 2 protein [Nocardioides marmorisolisilvae]|uniref:Glycosyltransferase family 2 protein n=1 Tax=Nocardioides marmorisolisilvae TaxID=1542737 RepID=A0A3N0DTP7_9ACTN|nr:glycosyltransferase family 2 protein [Nocardioides marmorisolisilvae]RNL78999.1 glycosyltransferase family 2 protein [Nocardioides marmorisolisilvae]
MDPTCTLILPCRDEAAALPEVIARVPAGVEILVVDNGSTDGTAEVARALGARVVTEPQPGYGAAVHAGVEAARTELVAVMDGDGSFHADDLVPLIDDVAQGRAQMAVGRRRPVRRGIWPWHARLGNQVAIAILRSRSGFGLHDIAPARVCRRDDLIILGVEDRRFGYPLELMSRASAAGWSIVERDLAYHPRARGTRSKVSGSVRGTFRTARDFLAVLR